MILVVDASVACKWFIEEPGSTAADALFTSGDRLLAPDLLIPEFTNVAWTKLRRSEISKDHAKMMIDELPYMIDDFVPSKDIATRALHIASAIDHPAYDCFYIALAEFRSGTLVTADKRLSARLQGTHWQAMVRLLD